MMFKKCKGFILFALLVVSTLPVLAGSTTAALPPSIHFEPVRVLPSFELGERTLRIATYNIHHGADAAGEQDLQGILKVVKELQADVLFLTEVDVGRSRSNYVDQVKYFAEGTRFPYYYYAPSLPRSGQYEQESQGASNLFGTLILSRFPILEASRHFLPGLFRVEPRVMLEAVLSVYGQEIGVFGVHLTVHRKLRQKQVDWVLRKVYSSHNTTKIILGDFNASPQSREIQRIVQAGFADASRNSIEQIFTFPAWSPHVQIDYIFLDRSLSDSHKRVEVPVSTASDHLPYLVDITLP